MNKLCTALIDGSNSVIGDYLDNIEITEFKKDLAALIKSEFKIDSYVEALKFLRTIGIEFNSLLTSATGDYYYFANKGEVVACYYTQHKTLSFESFSTSEFTGYFNIFEKLS